MAAELEGVLLDADDDAAAELGGELLAERGAPVAALLELLAHARAGVRRAALQALARRPDAPSGPLEARLGDGHDGVRRDACRALAARGEPRTAVGVARLLGDPRAPVRAAAAAALGHLASATAVAALDGLLRDERSAAVRREALGALAALGAAAPAPGGSLWADALAALATHTGREDDPALALAGAAGVARLLAGRPHHELLGPLRRVPPAARPALADALEGVSGAEGDPRAAPGLARVAAELRGLPPDAEGLARVGSDLTARALRGALGRAYGRERELQLLRDRLARPGPRSVVLVGPSGAGKTAIVEELAQQLATEPVLVPLVLHEATTGEVLSGTRYLGDWQTKLKALVDALRAPRRAVWYVPDVNRLVDAGTTQHSDESFAAMLAPALERGELTILGESTPEAFRRGLDRHPAFAKLFLKLRVEEPDRAATLAILGAVARDLEAEHARAGARLVVTDAALEHALDLAQDHLPGQARPGNAVGLLREAAQAAADEARLAARAAPGGVAREGPLETSLAVDPPRVFATLSRLTGVPVALLDDAVPLYLDAVRRFFEERVLGQDEAVEAMVDLIGLIKAGLTDPNRPLGVMLFVGPTGVGKTELAKATAEFIFGASDRLVRIDMGELKEPDSHRRLVGDPLAPDPAARFGLLTAPVRERPFSVVLLDEVEKAHRNVFDLLLPLLAEGRLTDEQGRVTDFRRAIILLTSNLGSDLREDVGLGFQPDDPGLPGKVARVLEDTFRPELVSRLGRVVVFAPLSVEVMRQLTRRELRRVLQRRGITRREVVVETDDSVIGTLLKEGFSERFGARPLERRVEALLLKPLARALLSLGPDDEAIVRLGVRNDRVVSEVLRPAADAEDELPARATSRVRDATGRLVSGDDLARTVEDLFARTVEVGDFLEREGLKGRKSALLQRSLAPGFWDDPAGAQAALGEIATIERTLEAPGRLEKRLERLEALVARARAQAGETRALHEAAERTAELAHDVEFLEYLARCREPVDRGDAWLLLRRVDDEEFPEDVVRAQAEVYLRYARRKGLAARVVHEAVTRRGLLREVGLKVEGACAHGLLAGERGLHEWTTRGETKRRKRAALVRVDVLPPATAALRPEDVTRERRPGRDEPGVLFKKHRLHLVLTHQPTLVALEGGTDGDDQAEPDALALLAARVAQAGRGGPDPGVVRRYALAHQSARDLTLGVRVHLDRVLEGELDELVLARLRR